MGECVTWALRWRGTDGPNQWWTGRTWAWGRKGAMRFETLDAARNHRAEHAFRNRVAVVRLTRKSEAGLWVVEDADDFYLEALHLRGGGAESLWGGMEDAYRFSDRWSADAMARAYEPHGARVVPAPEAAKPAERSAT